jgi:hypothetical protein
MGSDFTSARFPAGSFYENFVCLPYKGLRVDSGWWVNAKLVAISDQQQDAPSQQSYGPV